MNTPKTIPKLIEEYLAARDIAPTSKKSYYTALHYFFRYMVKKGRPADKPEESDSVRYRQHLLETHSIYTVNLYLSAIKGFFKWIEKNKYWKNIFEQTRPVKIPDYYAKLPLTIEQIRHLLSTIGNHKFVDRRDQTMIRLMFENGLRGIEVSRLSIGDIDFNSEAPAIMVMGKGADFKRSINISHSMNEALQILINESPETDKKAPVFRSYWKHSGEPVHRLTATEISQIISQRLTKAGLKSDKISGHSLRHAAAVALLEQTGDIFPVQTFLRHQNPKTTSIYIRHSQKSLVDKRKLETLLSNLANPKQS